jgi:DNA helicase II / ATP-dependent DNA helicase PcrA
LNQGTETSRYTSEALNPEQRVAVEHVDGPILVLAGAGSGKTRVLTSRVARLVNEHGVPPERILAVTFTNKAATEMRGRIRAMLNEDPGRAWIGTFHSVGARLLRRHAGQLGWDPAFTIFDAEESLREIRRVMLDANLDVKRWNPKAVRSVISDAKNQLVTPEAFREQHSEGFDSLARIVARVYPSYQRSLKTQNAFDFDDLLVKPVELLESRGDILEQYQSRFSFILVDEYQDTNHAQFRLLEGLARVHRNLMVVGDDDQSIYGWRGADIRNILDFEETYPGARVVRLEENYRSTAVILDAANAVIRRNTQRKVKTLRTQREGGTRIVLVEAADERDEAGWIADEISARVAASDIAALNDVAILYRTNAQSRAMEDAFRRRGIAYQIVGGVRFYERREIQDLIAYLRLISNPRDMAAFDRVVNLPRRGVGATSLERLKDWADSQGITRLEAAARASEAPGLSRGARQGLERFAGIVRDFEQRSRELAVGPLLEALVETLGFLEHLRGEGPEGEDRVENVKELIAGAMEFEAVLEEEWEGRSPDDFTELDLFLQQVALVTDLDRHDPEGDSVTFMTLHNAKGLEFPTVFLAGLEEGLFPLGRAYEEPEKLEEERRLFYVGITRAEDRLYMTRAQERRRAGGFMAGRLSSFVEDVPPELLELRRSPRLDRSDARSSGGGGGRKEAGGRGEDAFGAAARAAARRAHEERAFEEGLNQDQPHLAPGARVSHGRFGSGKVVEVSGFGDDMKVTVDFDSVGRKRLLARYAGLERDF